MNVRDLTARGKHRHLFGTPLILLGLIGLLLPALPGVLIILLGLELLGLRSLLLKKGRAKWKRIRRIGTRDTKERV